MNNIKKPASQKTVIFFQRYIKTESLEVLDKDELVDLYNKHILPLPQRKYRINRRGQQMTKKQVIAAKNAALILQRTIQLTSQNINGKYTRILQHSSLQLSS